MLQNQILEELLPTFDGFGAGLGPEPVAAAEAAFFLDNWSCIFKTRI